MSLVDPFGLSGQVLDGQFRVDRVIGEGGFSVVYKGHHVGLDEPIAIKCLKLPGALGSAVVESFVRRFRDESRIHYRLSQGNLYIARSIASGTTLAPATGALVPYMVLEWLEGRSLAADFTQRRVKAMRGRSMSETIKLLDSAVDALAYAHAKGVVHRDINPGNLFLSESRDGTKLKVLDFGVAKVVSDHALEMGPRAVTLGHIRIFSPAYAAPEQFEDKIGKVGPWTDVYAVTLVLLEALRDKGVNDGEHLGEFAMRALDETNRPTPRALGVPVGDETQALLARAVSLDPSERPQDAGELWGMLKHAVRKDADSGRPPHAHRPQSLPPRSSAMPHDTHILQAVDFPAVEVVRPASVTPPPVAVSPMPSAAAAMAGMGALKVDLPPKQRAGVSTVRMENRPALPGERARDDDAPPNTLRTGEIVAGRVVSTPPPQAAYSSNPPAPNSSMPNAMQGAPYGNRPVVSTAPPTSQAPAQGGVWVRPPRGDMQSQPNIHNTPLPPPMSRPPPPMSQMSGVASAPRSKLPIVIAIIVAILLLTIAAVASWRVIAARRAAGAAANAPYVVLC